MESIEDLYIKNNKYPDYDEFRLTNSAFEDVIVSKIEMILLTNKGDCTDPDFGADIPKYLWKTRFPASNIQQNIQDQFRKYIPELNSQDYKINVYIFNGSSGIDIGVIQILLGIKNVNFLYK